MASAQAAASAGVEIAGTVAPELQPSSALDRELANPDAANTNDFLPTTAEAAARYLLALAPGETPMPLAPVVRLHDGTARVPSQYLLFNQTLEAVQAVLDRIRYRHDILLFASTEDANPDRVYIQVGIIGMENYPYNATEHPRKLLYGRKWRVERDLPTSELIQAVFLAIKCVEEHEAREVFTYRGRTVFNNHFDIPLMREWMAGQPGEVESRHESPEAVQALMDHARYHGCRVRVDDVAHRRNGRVVMDVVFERDEAMPYFNPHLQGVSLTVLCDDAKSSSLIYGLMDAILHYVTRHVEENFTLDDFARFSRSISVEQLRAFLRFHRDRASLEFAQAPTEAFFASAEAMNGAIGTTRPPVLRSADLGVARYLDSQQPLGGIMPGGYTTPPDYVPSGSY